MCLRFLFFCAASSLALVSCSSAQTSDVGRVPAPNLPGHLLSYDFASQRWPASRSQTSGGASAQVASGAFGTIDTYKGEASAALSLSADFTKAGPTASASLWSGPLPVQNRENDPGKLSLSCDLWVSETRPVRVVIQSLDRNGKVSGSRSSVIYPPVANAYYRFSLDLNKTTPLAGKFDPRAPQIQLVFALDKTDSIVGPAQKLELRLDNVNLSAPAWYVSSQGNDSADGRTERTAFATIQKAVNAAVPGDTVLVMGGVYNSAPKAELVKIAKAGTPANWIVLRNAPGQSPILRGDGWNVVSLDQHSAYIEIRGMTVHGHAAEINLDAALSQAKVSSPDPSFNTNGLALDARKGEENGGKAHHIRFIDNTVYEMPGGGISAIAGDHITVEANHVYENAHWMRYAGSGISVFRGWDFDADAGTKNFVLGNRSYRNRCFVPWGQVGKISDGNGIIIDDFINYQNGASNIPYGGRTLVQNNLVFGNGGSGIHAYASNHVDIVHNTAYANAQSPELQWRQIFAGGRCNDVRIVNNIWWAQSGRPVNFAISQSNRDILYAHNLVFGAGDNTKSDSGGLGTEAAQAQATLEGNLSVDPDFVAPSLDGARADFHLKPQSVALNAAGTALFRPLTDLDGKRRGAKPDVGAYESKP